VLLSNVATWTERSGYFAPDVRQLPLSHLWSISVEERYADNPSSQGTPSTPCLFCCPALPLTIHGYNPD
jgi:hypothetical protein